MTEQQYQIWWQLHRRFAKGEFLSETELREYKKGRKELETEEQQEQRGTLPAILLWQKRWQELNRQAQNLAQQDATLRQQATLLEDQYLALTGEKLCLEA